MGGCRSKVKEQTGRTELTLVCSLEPSLAEHQETWRFLNDKYMLVLQGIEIPEVFCFHQKMRNIKYVHYVSV